MYKEEPDLPNMENAMEEGKKKKVRDHNFLTESARKKTNKISGDYETRPIRLYKK